MKLDGMLDIVEDYKSPPVWGRGLKLSLWLVAIGGDDVAPRVGAWIETLRSISKATTSSGRPPCGGVD